ncbi:MAG: DNA-processing protein DprA [Candidatus Berkelbacteria bacterium]|nr:DNA-processing protein DprA [Candidatus Berkelbacteria bacterium]
MKTKDTIIALSSNPDISSREIIDFIRKNKSNRGYLKENCQYKPGRSEVFRKSLEGAVFSKIKERCKRGRIEIVTYLDKNYPRLLAETADLPAVLYCRGNLNLLKPDFPVAIVGSRRPTSYGLKYTHKFAFELASRGAEIVSGLALGIDGEAHRGALDASGKTVAVLGTAIDEVYPSYHQSLARTILGKSGLIISEYPPSYPTYRMNFPRRNRIIAGLSKAVIITEAAKGSGSLITAELAADYDRDIYALPGSVDSIFSYGANYLLRSGAIPITSTGDLLSDYGFLPERAKEMELEGNEEKVYDLISKGVENFDNIQKALKLEATELNQLLLKLEIRGLVKENKLGGYKII